MGPWCGLGGYTGWVLPRPTHPATRLRAARRTPGAPSEAGPGRPCRGLKWVGCGVRGLQGVRRLGTAPETTLRARSVPPWGPPCLRTLGCRLRANTARFRSIFSKVSQNDEVSPKSVEKACRSPYFQNEAQKSPLEILGFPF